MHDYAVKQGLDGKYSQFIFAGAAIGAVAPKFADWHKTFWDNLAITIQLDNIKSAIEQAAHLREMAKGEAGAKLRADLLDLAEKYDSLANSVSSYTNRSP